MKVALYGALPPPIGGVTAHVSDLRDLLEWDHEVRVVPLQAQAAQLVPHLLAVLKWADVHHLHASLPVGAKLATMTALLRLLPSERTAVTLHSGRAATFYRESASRWRHFRRLVGAADHWIALNSHIAATLQDAGARRVHRAPSFIWHARLDDVRAIPSAPPGAQLIMTSGYETTTYQFEQLVTVCARLRAMGHRVVLSIATYGPRHEALMHTWQVAAVREGVPYVHLRAADRDTFLGVLKGAAAYVRNTTWDSYGVAVAEAIAMGVPAFATDVCERAAGAQVYPLNDVETLVRLLNAQLDMLNASAAGGRVARPGWQDAPRPGWREYNLIYSQLCSPESQ
jgi:glycosyltransferase involved in cell wall biosynthesis